MKNPLHHFGRLFAGKKTRWITILAWILLIGLFSSIWPQVNEEEENSSNLLPDDAMSVQASNLIKEEFSDESTIPLLMVWYRERGLQDQDYDAIQSLYGDLKNLNLDAQLPPFDEMPVQALQGMVSEDGEAITTPILFAKGKSIEYFQESVADIKKIVEGYTNDQVFSEDFNSDGLHVRLTGPVGISIDANELFGQADMTLLLATVLLVLVLLVALYRSPILALIPLIGVGFAYALISPILGFMAREGWIVVDAQAVSIMTVLLFGAGTDYCLFLVSRYRDELRMEPNQYKALHLAISNSGGAIIMSAATTAVGLFTLIFANYASYDRFAVPFSLAIIAMAISIMTLLPAILALFGRKAFFPFIPRTEQMIKEIEAKKGKGIRHPKVRSKFSQWVSQFVVEKPWRIIITSLVFLGILAAFVPKINYTYGLLQSFPEDIPSREGFTILSEHFPKGEIAPIEVIVDSQGKEFDLQEKINSTSIVESISDPVEGKNNSDLLRYTVILNEDPYSKEAVEFIGDVKEIAAQELKNAGVTNADEQIWIGGETASLYDTEEITSADQNRIIPIVLLIITVLLLVYLKSIVAVAYLVFTVVLSFFSALGIGWLIIHYVMGADAMQGLIPLYAFVFLVALGGDYNIFMISSIWKNRERMSLKRAISEGVGETSNVISSAGLILAGTFFVLSVMPIQVLVQFGIVTAIGVLLDTFVVRPLLVPAITTVLGKYAYWPGKLWKKTDTEKQHG